MRRISIILLALLGAATLAAEAKTASAGGFTLRGTVSRVVDGDTVDVRLTSGRTERIRLIGIDTPERGECDAAKATAYARSLAQGRAAVLQGDTTQAKRDRYGRLLAYAWIGGRDLGQQQLARGFAKVYVYDRPFQRLAAYQQAERAGKTRTDGIWRACTSPPPPPTSSRGSCDPSYRTCASRLRRRTSTARTFRTRSSASSAPTRTGSTATTTESVARAEPAAVHVPCFTVLR